MTEEEKKKKKTIFAVMHRKGNHILLLASHTPLAEHFPLLGVL